MNDYTADMFNILRASLFTNDDIRITDWESVFDEMKKQTVAALPGQWLSLHLDAAPWNIYCLKQRRRWIRVMHGQDQLLQLLEENGIPCVIIKGAAAAMYYPDPTLRTMGDVDFLVKRCDFEKAAVLLETNGYALAHEKKPEQHHYNYSRNGITFELHRRIPVVAESDERWMAFFENGIDGREWQETEGHRFPVFPPLLNGMVLIFHINQHLRTGLGLRQVIDWMMYVHTLSPEKWKELQPLLKRTGTEKLARTVTLMCQRYLGLEKVVEEDDSLPVNDLMEYILEKGNFGHKAGLKGKIAMVSLLTETGGFFARLQKGGLLRWKAAQKYEVLRPFAWIYQICRIMGILIENGISPAETIKSSRKSHGQRHLIESLGLKTDRTISRDEEGENGAAASAERK